MVIVGSVSVGLTDLDRRRIYEVYGYIIDSDLCPSLYFQLARSQ